MRTSEPAFTVGAFDLFHLGHLRFVTTARQHCTQLKVGLGSDQLLPQSKGRAPVYSEAHHMEILHGLRCVWGIPITALRQPLAQADG